MDIILDFYIPEEYRGKEIPLPCHRPDWPKEDVTLSIPPDAYYLDINPLEFEEEYQGCQDESWRQQLRYYDRKMHFITTQDLENQIITYRLMSRLERLLKKQY